MVAIANDVSIQNINIGLLFVNTAPCLERAAKSAVENDMNSKLVKNHAVQWTPLLRPMTCNEEMEQNYETDCDRLLNFLCLFHIC